MKDKLIVFSDHIGRTVAGVKVSEDDKTLVVKNPVIVHIEPNPQTKQLHAHTYPYMFMEVVSPETRETNEWTFNKPTIVISNIQLDDRLTEAVLKVNDPSQSQATVATQSESKIVNLFDNE